MPGVGLVAAAHHQHRDVQALEQPEAVERGRPRGHAQGVGDRAEVAVALDALAGGQARPLTEALGQVVRAGPVHERVDVPAVERLGERVPVVEVVRRGARRRRRG